MAKLIFNCTLSQTYSYQYLGILISHSVVSPSFTPLFTPLFPSPSPLLLSLQNTSSRIEIILLDSLYKEDVLRYRPSTKYYGVETVQDLIKQQGAAILATFEVVPACTSSPQCKSETRCDMRCSTRWTAGKAGPVACSSCCFIPISQSTMDNQHMLLFALLGDTHGLAAMCEVPYLIELGCNVACWTTAMAG